MEKKINEAIQEANALLYVKLEYQVSLKDSIDQLIMRKDKVIKAVVNIKDKNHFIRIVVGNSLSIDIKDNKHVTWLLKIFEALIKDYNKQLSIKYNEVKL